MKIIIIGGGIGGLSVYLALKKYLSDVANPLTLKLFECRPVMSTVGGGLGLAPNGLRSLSAISSDALHRIQAVGFHSYAMTFRNSAGTLIGQLMTGRKERYGFDHLFLSRASVHQAVLPDVPQSDIELGKKVVQVRELEDGVEVVFEDGTVERGDIVIGADGVHSIIREAVIGTQCKAEYDGFTGVGGFLPVSALSQELRDSLKDSPANMTFGAQGFFGYALTSSAADEIMWWSSYEATPPPSRDTLLRDIRAQLVARHAQWKSPFDDTAPPIGAEYRGGVFASMIALACGPDSDDDNDNSGGGATASTTAVEKNLLILPRYVAPPLPRWCSLSGRTILLGDAAHALPPDSGQGVSCAMEDALALALLLKHHLTVEGDSKANRALEKVAEGYQALRMDRIAMILAKAKRRRDMKKKKTWWEELIRDWMLWFVCKLPESLNDSFFAYDIEAEVAKYLANSP